MYNKLLELKSVGEGNKFYVYSERKNKPRYNNKISTTGTVPTFDRI